MCIELDRVRNRVTPKGVWKPSAARKMYSTHSPKQSHAKRRMETCAGLTRDIKSELSETESRQKAHGNAVQPPFGSPIYRPKQSHAKRRMEASLFANQT